MTGDQLVAALKELSDEDRAKEIVFCAGEWGAYAIAAVAIRYGNVYITDVVEDTL